MAAAETAIAELQAARPPKSRTRAPRPADAEIMETRRLWKDYQVVAWKMYGPRSQSASKARFAERHHFPEREFRRAFSLTDKRGLGNGPRRGYNTAIRKAAETLQETLKQSHGTRRDS